MISWTFEPLERGAEIEADWRQGSVGLLEFPGESTIEVVRRRPDLQGRYFHSVHMGHLGLFEIDPATATAMHWLLNDLQSLKWVTGVAQGTPRMTGRVLAIRTAALLAGFVMPPP